jgi:hypothetical protein
MVCQDKDYDKGTCCTVCSLDGRSEGSFKYFVCN